MTTSYSKQLLTIAALICSSFQPVLSASAELPSYTPAKLEAGSFTSVGSDSMDELVRVWVEEYRKYQPQIDLQVISRGSATAPAALIEGSADLGPMARPMKSFEREDFISKYGFEPHQVRTAIAAVSIYLPESSPKDSLTFEELEKLYALNETAEVRWQDVGVSGPFGESVVVPFGREQESYLTTYFRQQVLKQAPFTKQFHSTADLPAMAEALKMNPAGIAFGAYSDKVLPGVKVVPVSRRATEAGVKPSTAAIASGKYPLARFLNIYIVREPGEPLDPTLKDFLSFILSKQGQAFVAREGLYPLPASVLKEERAKLQ